MSLQKIFSYSYAWESVPYKLPMFDLFLFIIKINETMYSRMYQIKFVEYSF